MGIDTERTDLDSDVERMLATRRLFLFGDLEKESRAQNLIEDLLLLNDDNPRRDIELVLNCTGGSMWAAAAVYDVMRLVKPRVKTTVLGTCQSAALLLCAAGAKGHRAAGQNASFLWHPPRWSSEDATPETMAVDAAAFSRWAKNDLALFAKCTGKSATALTRLLGREKWFGAREAKRIGFIDKVI